MLKKTCFGEVYATKSIMYEKVLRLLGYVEYAFGEVYAIKITMYEKVSRLLGYIEHATCDWTCSL